MKIMITGAGGFIGTHLKAALRPEHELLTPSEKHMDLRFPAEVEGYIQDHKPEIVIHLAAKTEVALSFDDYEDFQRVNYVGTVVLAEANRRFNPDLKQFIFASTMETYGDQPDFDAYNEVTPQSPKAPYAVAKVACEKYLRYMKMAYKFPYTILRQTNAYGRTNTDFFVMERIITQMLKGSIVRLGASRPERNFLFIDDLVDLYKIVLNNPKAIGQVFVTGPNNALPIHELVQVCADILCWDGSVEWNTIPPRPGEVFRLNSDPDFARAQLGWQPKWSLSDGIHETAERIRAAWEKAKAA